MAGGAGGHIAVFERPRRDTEYVYNQYRTFKNRQQVGIIGLAISPSNETIVCSLENRELQKFVLANILLTRHLVVVFVFGLSFFFFLDGRLPFVFTCRHYARRRGQL